MIEIIFPEVNPLLNIGEKDMATYILYIVSQMLGT